MPETTLCHKARVIYGDFKEKVLSTLREAAVDTLMSGL